MGFIQGYLDSGASQYACMLAFSLLVSLLPLMLGVLTVLGLLAGTVGHQQRLVVLRQLLVDIVPANVQGAVSQVVLESSDHLGAVALLSEIGLVWFSTGVFSTSGFADQPDLWHAGPDLHPAAATRTLDCHWRFSRRHIWRSPSTSPSGCGRYRVGLAHQPSGWR